MAGINYNTARREMANRLRQMSQILMKYGICTDASMLDQAAASCQNYSTNAADAKWGYSFSSLKFLIGKPAGLQPGHVDSVTIVLSADVLGDFSRPAYDQFTSLAIDIEKMGFCEGRVCSRGTWHFDRHITGDDDADDDNKDAGEFHPLYHVHHGGRKLTDNLVDYGDFLTMDAPRLLHPPIEAVLAIDIILANFLKPTWDTVWNDGQYRNNVSPAYHDLWKPFIEGLSNFFSTPRVQRDENLNQLLPLEL